MSDLLRSGQLPLLDVCKALLQLMWKKEEAERIAKWTEDGKSLEDYKPSAGYNVFLPLSDLEKISAGHEIDLHIGFKITGDIQTKENTFLVVAGKKPPNTSALILARSNGKPH